MLPTSRLHQRMIADPLEKDYAGRNTSPMSVLVYSLIVTPVVTLSIPPQKVCLNVVKSILLVAYEILMRHDVILSILYVHSVLLPA